MTPEAKALEVSPTLPDVKESAVAVRESRSLLPNDVSGMSVEQVRTWMDDRARKFDVVRMAALKITRPGDWTNMGGKPYLEASGARKMRGLFGVTIETPVLTIEEIHDADGPCWTFTFMGRASHSFLASVPAMGTCSSRDDFFGIESEWKKVEGSVEKVKVKRPKTIMEINAIRGNLEKTALTNYQRNAIVQILGLDGLEWSDVTAETQITPEQCGKVAFQKGAKGGQADTSLITEPQAKRVYAIANSHGIKMESLVSYLTENAAAYGIPTEGDGKPTSVDQAIRRVRKADYNRLCAWLGVPEDI